MPSRYGGPISVLLQALSRTLARAGLAPADRLVVGFSGGPDSLALLWGLHHLARQGQGPQPIPVHVDHRLHPESAALARRAAALGEQLGLTVLVRTVDIQAWPELREGGTEAGARAARYAALAEVAQENHTRWIAVGHTRDDQAETLVLRLLRGAGLDGLAGMRPLTELSVPLDPEHRTFVPIQLLRPLLTVRRQTIQAALSVLGLEPIEDPTNRSLAFERNLVRQRVMPVLEEVRSGAAETLAQVAEQLQDDADYLHDLAREAYRTIVRFEDAFAILDRARFRQTARALQRRVLQLTVRDLVDPTWTLSRERILALSRAVERGRPATRVELGRGIVASIGYTEAVLGPAARIENFLLRRSGYPLLEPGAVIPLRSGMTVRLANGWSLVVHRAEEGRWFLRTRRTGDRLMRPGFATPVRLQDWLVNEKIPSYLRDRLPMVADDGVVWWIAGLGPQRFVAPDGTVVELRRSEEAQGVNETVRTVPGELERVLIDEATLQKRVAELGNEIAQAYRGQRPILIGVLTGAFVFMADLIRHLPIELDVDFMAVSSYGQATVTSGVVRILKDLDRPIEGRDVLLVEDIIDSGLTLQYLLDVLRRRNPRSLRVVVLLRKQKPEAIQVPVDWVGFDIPDEFVVGYGLDAAGRFRNLPFIAVYRATK